jgi:peroxiredoxin
MFTFAVGMGLLLGQRAPAVEREVKIGATIANLTFKDIHYLPRSLDDFEKKKAFVLVFTNTSCPVVQRYFPTLQALEKEYRHQGAQFLAVNVGTDDSIVDMAAQAVKYEVEFPFVKDADGACAQALGVQRTPEVVVLDVQRRLCYRGRIDDQYRLGGTRATATHHDLKEALEAVLAGRAVAVKETPVDGCLITRPETRAPKAVTFADHVAPILKKYCQDCHRPNTAAPFSLLTYKQVASRADTIAEVVAEGRMPPWFGSSEHGPFMNRRVLSADERDTVLDWVRLGMPKGDESKLPKPQPNPRFSGKWRIGQPDLVLSAPKVDHLPANGDVAYKYVTLPHVFQEDTWVQGVQILPDNPRVVHHCNMIYFTPTDGFKKSNFITGVVPGSEPMFLDQGVAFLIPKGASLLLQIHYVTTGKEEDCRISVGLRYAREVVRKRLHHLFLEDTKFKIPPGAPAYPVQVTRDLPQEAIGLALFCHMHLRGRDMSFRALYPDGKSETLLIIPNYSFDWQIPYRWEDGKKRFPKGTRIECRVHYDNSAFNPYNPNPDDTVKEGPQTYHEMLNGFMFYLNANENLNLDIDPKTGHIRAKDTKAADAGRGGN